MTAENGGLWAVPASHKGMLKCDYEDSHVSYKGDVSHAEFISAAPGDMVLFSSFLLHSSTPNIIENSRWTYVVEYMQTDHMDPLIDAPYLVVAKNGQPDLHYLNRLPAQDDWINRWKYWDVKQKVKKQMKSILTTVKSTVVKKNGFLNSRLKILVLKTLFLKVLL